MAGQHGPGVSVVAEGMPSSYQIISIPPGSQHANAMTLEQQQPSGSGGPSNGQFFQPIQGISTSATQQHTGRGRKRAALDLGSQQMHAQQAGTSRAQLFIEQGQGKGGRRVNERNPGTFWRFSERIVLNQQPTTVVPTPMLVQHPPNSLQTSSHQVGIFCLFLPYAPPLQMHLNPVIGSAHSIRNSSSSTLRLGRPTAADPSSSASASLLSSQPQYILSTAPHLQQSQSYDMEAAMIEMIVRHLGNLNDDEVGGDTDTIDVRSFISNFFFGTLIGNTGTQ